MTRSAKVSRPAAVGPTALRRLAHDAARALLAAHAGTAAPATAVARLGDALDAAARAVLVPPPVPTTCRVGTCAKAVVRAPAPAHATTASRAVGEIIADIGDRRALAFALNALDEPEQQAAVAAWEKIIDRHVRSVDNPLADQPNFLET